MPLRLKTLIFNRLHLILTRKILFSFLVVVCFFQFSAQTSGDDVKKEAAKLFEEEDYSKAYKLYSQLVANYPKDPDYNYRLGVCMIYAEADKKKCLPYLKFADSKPNEAPKETKFYLGKAYHVNYLFDEAIKYYNEYKKIGSSSQQKKLQVDKEIKSCAYGKRLLSNLSDLEVKSKKELNEADYFRSYDLKDIGGKLLVKPDDFKTGADKKKKEKSVVYLPKSGDRVYFSSYGEGGDNKDIYYALRLPGGGFGKPQKVSGINSDYDEDYPFLHPNGTTLYFASKGHNSMGGYDIFKSTYNETTNTWGPPVNLEFPINSPDDDYLYVTDSLEKTAYFSTGRQSPPGKIDVLRINTERKPIDILALKGTVVKESADQSLKSKITVKNMDNGNIVGIYEAQDNGDYLMDLPNGAKLLYTVETPGLKTQSDKVGLPMVSTSKPLKQTISYEKGILKIINYFEETPTDDSYLQYLKIIEQKAKLDVNEGQNKFNPTLANNGNNGNSNNTTTNNTNNTNNTNKNSPDTGSVKTNTGSVTAVKNGSNTSVSNKQLADIAKKDAEESQKEANQLSQDAADAFELGNQKKIEADKKLKEAEDALTNAQAIANEEEKKAAIDKAVAIKTEAETEKNIATKILDYAKNLDNDAKIKIKEAELNKQYANELDKTANGKNTSSETIAKLNDLQKQIDDLSNQKTTSDQIYNTIKSDIEEKEKQITKIEKNNGDIKTNLDEINTEIKNSEDELAKTRKKKDKEAIESRISEMKDDKTGKEKQINENNTELTKLKDELAALNKQLDLTNKIKTETIAVNTNTTPIANNSTNSGNNNNTSVAKSTSEILADKYKDKINVTDDSNKSNLEIANTQLKNYNKELDAAIAKTKTDITKTKNTNTKEKLNNELKQLESDKKQNQQEIANNNKKIDEINKTLAGNNSNSGNTVKPINATNNNDAVTQLGNLNTKLDGNDYNNFDYNSYQNSQAQTLKVEADSKINEAVAQQKKLKEFIDNVKTQIQNSGNTNATSTSTVTPAQLHKEAEEHSLKAFDYRSEANTKTGKEKEDLITKAKEEDVKANEKNLKAAELTATDNKSTFDTNKDNLKLLIDANKANETEVAEAKKLEQEADVAFKQALAIREEANSLPNLGAKLGNLSNAEEKETEALNKLQEAINSLKKLTPDVALKTPVTSGSNTGATNSNGFNNSLAQLQTVNAGLNDLLNTKNNAYLKLYDANTAELEQQLNALKANEELINKTPRLKSEFVSINNKVNSAKSLKQATETSSDNGKKLNDLTEATKKQIDALKQLNAFTKTVTDAAASTPVANNNGNANNNTGNNNSGNSNNTNTTVATTNTNNSNNNTANTNTTSASTNNTTVATNNNNGNNTTNTNTTVVNTNTVSENGNTNSSNTNTASTSNSNTTNTTVATNNTGNNTNTTTVNTNTVNENNNNTTNTNATTATTIDVKSLAQKDTSAAQVVNYFDSNKTSLGNPQANVSLSKSLNELKNIEKEKASLEAEIKNSGSNTSVENPAQLKTKADNTLTEAEDLNVKAFDLRTLANTKSGKEKDSLLVAAKELDNQSQNKKIDASMLTQKANDINLSSNENAITELIAKLKNDNPTLATELESKINEIQTLRTQSKQLREEANAQTNTNAKIGALSNAEEKEAETIQKQNDLIAEFKKQYPDYVVKQTSGNNSNSEIPANLKQKQTELTEKEYTELTNVTNAFSLEYETSKNSIPENLTDEQKVIKQNADDLNAESKRLLIQSASEKNPNEKVKLLTLAAKTGNAAIQQINKIAAKKPIASNNNNGNNPTNNNNSNNTSGTNNNNPSNNTGNNPASNNNSNNNNTNNNTATANNNSRNNNNGNNNTNNTNNTTGRGTVKIEGLEVTAGNAYSANKPIPIDSKIPDGLVFRVQIGAFKNQLPNNTFRGLSPVNGETTPNGYIRYTAGNFTKLENANGVKNDLKNLGYSDAFVVVYYNGKRISLNEALDIMSKEGKTVDNNAPQTAGINANANIPKANTNAQNPNLNAQDAVTITKELEQINGLLYTVQIGVYSKKVNKQQLFNLKPIYSEKLTNGLYRYTAGVYNNSEKIVTDKNRVVSLGVKDAFVSAYYNGKRTSFADGKTKQQDSTVKMEPENPIIFPDANTPLNNTPANQPANNNLPANTPTVQPFKNGVTSYPAATAENGIKSTEEGVCFKVQIGAYSKQVPNDVAAKFLSIKTWPIENKVSNALYIYNIGNFSEAKFAKTLKEEAIRLGLTDAFITVYKDGQKLSGAEALQYLTR